ncbi:hypothetical protein KAFR_0K00950 [Kazachstania africana CBS 2517]|uniref:Phosphatidylserine decarboxylase proenzyme 2 n=1 Tax=Kazachstania africana (strain ATCC 22294 / BCRC 22015 / CBS 2517 / CECT 1963 / NBRC 1671 / NRRL Y-8276) TaxID=1071382 RepID=H2B1F1_KAZAF|nr:hypothetical protein KAFR_0K00950 [Kazachstania africana CBS 2517]CCF60451.1 hypothetical protein KAFR_0K00950 [Kazachstania africana CBS 2517]
MRLISRKRHDPTISLKVHVVSTRKIDFFEKFNCNPMCLVSTNLFYNRKTDKLKSSHTNWNQILKLKLPDDPTSDLLRIIVYDVLFGDSPASSAASSRAVLTGSDLGQRHRHRDVSYLYVGEVQLSLLELFKNKETPHAYNFHIPNKWYRLYDYKRNKNVIGEIQLGFTLICDLKKLTTYEGYRSWEHKLLKQIAQKKSRRMREHSPTSNFSSENLLLSSDFQNFNSTDSITNEESPTNLEMEEEDEDDADEDEDDADEDEYIDSLDILSKVALEMEDEGDLVDDDNGGSAIDLKSLVTALDEYDVMDDSIIEGDTLDKLLSLDEDDTVVLSSKNDPLLEKENTRPMEEDTGYAEDDESDSDEETSLENLPVKLRENSILRVKKRSNKAYRQNISNQLLTNFQVHKKQHAMGVAFVEFVCISNLPLMKKKVTKRGFDMDPFIVAIFGRRVFKTSTKKHTLDPYFNESIAFEVYPHEANYNFHFKVIDQDSITFNDKIANYSLSWHDFLQKQNDNHSWTELNIPLNLLIPSKNKVYKQPILTIKTRFIPYSSLKNSFWKHAVKMRIDKESFDFVEVILFLEKLGSFTTEDTLKIFSKCKKLPWSGDHITRDELIESLVAWPKTSEFKNIWRCPRCYRSRKNSNNSTKSKLMVENDLITHFSICSFSSSFKTLKASYVSSEFASKRWFSKVLIKLTYGRYALGKNNANILVQDRETGIIIEEKISAHVKVGMRILYNGKGPETKKFKRLLKVMSIRQGRKFDSPLSVKQIEPFIKFHSLDTSECLETEYKCFNEFFYRKLKPGSRTPESPDPRVLISPADSRCTTFSSIQESKEIWIKGTKFSIGRLTNNYEHKTFNEWTTSVAVFRLAPQDYHRFHSPCDGVIGEPQYIDGEYYTVNPMAVRSELDVFGENIRVIIPIETEEFGQILFIPVGAMMVGSIILTCKKGDRIERGQELGYFKFGGSTIIVVLQKRNLYFDSDLVKNSSEQLETLVKVGMSIGHAPDIPELKRSVEKLSNPDQIRKVKERISITDENVEKLNDMPWQYRTLKEQIYDDLGDVDVSVTHDDTPF